MKDVTSYSKLYVISLVVFGLLSVFSFVILLAGIFCESRTLIFLSGIGFSGFGSILGFLALPIGFVTELITGGVKGSLNRHVRWVLSTFLLTGACVSLFSLSIPSGKINPQTLLPLMLMAVVLSVIGLLPFFRAFTGLITLGVFIIHIASLFLPINMGMMMQEKISDVCFFLVAPKRITVTYESMKKGEIEFFRKDGKPKVWYYKKENGTFELFNGEGHHPTYDANLRPVTQEIITIIEKQLYKEEKERQEKIEQARQAQIKFEQLRQEKLRQEQVKKEQLEQERLKQEQIKQEQLEQERRTQEQIKKEQKEQLDREEASRKDLMKPGVYMLEEKLGRFGRHLTAYLHRVDILDNDRTIRVTLLIENDTRSNAWIRLKEPYGCFVVLDNLGNRYSPKTPFEEYYTCWLPTNRVWIQLDFEPLRRNVKYLRFDGLMIATWDYGDKDGKVKFEYTLKPTDR